MKVTAVTQRRRRTRRSYKRYTRKRYRIQRGGTANIPTRTPSVPQRKCYLLTSNEQSARTQFSKTILERVGFQVIPFQAIPHTDKVLSNKLSFIEIYNRIAKGEDEWVYVFEDDINILEPVTLHDIIPYESISSMFFYLGMCDYGPKKTKENPIKINNHPVIMVSGHVRGAHAIGISKKGAAELAIYANNTNERYMDVCLENFTKLYPANVMRYDLESYIDGHRGVFYQDRNRFPSIVSQ